MNRMAVDVVLLPDEAMAARAIEANAALEQSGASRIVLDSATCLPHISLAMGCIERRDVKSIEENLRTVVDRHPVGTLTITGVVTSLNARGEPVSAFAMAKTQALQTLHERVMEATQAHFTYDATDAMMHGAEETAETSLAWIRTFREKAAWGAFFLHITLGYGVVRQAMCFPIDFAARGLALCHLGNHCTCREVLAEVTL